MQSNFERIFGGRKPVVGMVHLGALPGTPLYDQESGLLGLVRSSAADLAALQAAGFDAVMFDDKVRNWIKRGMVEAVREDFDWCHGA